MLQAKAESDREVREPCAVVVNRSVHKCRHFSQWHSVTNPAHAPSQETDNALVARLTEEEAAVQVSTPHAPSLARDTAAAAHPDSGVGSNPGARITAMMTIRARVDIRGRVSHSRTSRTNHSLRRLRVQ